MRRLPPLALLAGILAGCGGGGDDEPGRTLSVEAGAPVPVSAKEYSFDPKTIIVASPGPVLFMLKNEGELAHDLTVTKDGKELGGVAAFAGRGKTKGGAVELPPGEYEFVCSVGDHEQLGMKGKLRVR